MRDTPAPHPNSRVRTVSEPPDFDGLVASTVPQPAPPWEIVVALLIGIVVGAVAVSL